MDGFGQILRRHRQAAGMSLRQLGEAVPCSFSHLSKVERGQQPATEKVAQRCDEVLRAGGALIEAHRTEQAGDTDMNRRTVLRALTVLAATPVPLVKWEALRHSMAAATDPDGDRWDQAVADYGHAYYRMPHGRLMDNLYADLTVLRALIEADTGRARDRLLAAAGRLSVIVALGMVAAGETIAAGRWWRDAHRYADTSRDPDAILTSRAWDVVNGCYDGRTPAAVVALSDQVLPLADGRASAAVCGLLAGRAQALSLAGRHAEAVATVQQLAHAADRLDGTVIGDDEGLWGWPEHRLRHTEAWVYAHAGQLPEAERAQTRALALYPPTLSRLRAQVQLHHAAALIRGGHIPDGLRLAADTLDGLPADQHNELLRTVARQVTAAVPTVERRRRPAYGELVARVTG